MPAPHPPEFRRRAVDLANLRDEDGKRVHSIAGLAKDLGISESCLRRWIDDDEVETGNREGLTGKERKELVELRRKARTLEMENEILKRAAAYFAKENVLPNDLRVHPGGVLGHAGRGGVSSDERVQLWLLPASR